MNPNDRCIAHLEAGGLLLTRDLRQARILRRLHDRAQVGAGRRVWPSAQVLPLDVWLALQWQAAASGRPRLPGILSGVALRWLWRQQVEQGSPGLIDPADLGIRARASWLRLRAFGGDIGQLSRWPLTRDQQAFLGWARAMEEELRARDAGDGGDLARMLVESAALPGAGPDILLAGFRRLTPAQSRLMSALRTGGRTVDRLDPQGGSSVAWQHAAPDPETERRTMLAWLRERIERQPDGIHAVVVPELDRNRGVLERALASTLQPELELAGAGRDERNFDIAGGHALATRPVVDAALAALSCLAGPVDWTVASRLLRSEHLAAAQAERAARIAADLALRNVHGQARLAGVDLAARASKAGAPAFAAALSTALSRMAADRRRSAGGWAEAFGAGLALFGWPGEATLGSHDFQAARKFGELLRELAALGSVASDLEAAQALAELRRLAAVPFQPESGEPAVFVLDTFDDPGVRFDSLWVAGLTATAWPRAVTVDPLLPIEIQRQLGMPEVAPEDCVAEARDIIGRWQAQAGALVLSWPRRENDTDVDGSPLVPRDLPSLPPPAPLSSRERLAFDAARLEPVPETRLPPLVAAAVAGGARVLELQSQCAFRAFGELRLGARPLEEPQAGFDRRLRGIVLHRALQTLWNGLGGQSVLASLDDAAVVARIGAAVEQAMRVAAPAGAGARMIALECEWQRRAIGRMVALERTRPPFTVLETERGLTVPIGGLELSLRVDRVDSVGEDLIVIDYKTGHVKNSAWRGARMDAPQLPLYAVLHAGRPTGIAFAGIGAARAKFVGVSHDGGAIDGLRPASKFELTEDRQKGFDWRQITAHWRAWLERLAEDFAAGRAIVDPKLGADTCRFCHLAALCRVAPGVPEEADGDVGDDD
ncbi:MAG TPA: PD-(D/E)XK nuclease family protein [Steroidobacteraceae bacterium]|nr:PD-(D/E)XK nuclease family protein [Steroidobacteraceae bacterium]